MKLDTQPPLRSWTDNKKQLCNASYTKKNVIVFKWTTLQAVVKTILSQIYLYKQQFIFSERMMTNPKKLASIMNYSTFDNIFNVLGFVKMLN